MWLSAVRLVVPASRGRLAGDVVAVIERDGVEVARVLLQRPFGRQAAGFEYRLDALMPDPASGRSSGSSGSNRSNRSNRNGSGPDHGVEVADWLRGHIAVRLLDDGEGTADGVSLFVRFLHHRPEPGGVGWSEAASWHFVGTLGREVPVLHGPPASVDTAGVPPVLTAVG